jgi:hypothetical protein
MALGKFVWCSMFAACALVAACGGDDDEDDGGGASGSGGSSAAAGTGGKAGAGGGNVSCDPADDGTCENDTDCPKVESGEARSSAQSCGLSCLQDEDQATCAVTCIVEDTGITQDCAGCYAAAVKCAADNCLAQCGSDPASQACSDCQVENGCRSAFDTCSGLPPQG